MKSLLKGLRYISQVFESEKEEEIQIGNPTDVKHVAHIGWDGASPNATPPSWMTEFKSGESGTTEGGVGEDDASVKCMSEYGGRSRDLPNLPKSTRKSASEKGSPTKAEKSSDKTKRRSSKKGTSSSSRKSKQGVSEEDLTSWSRGLPEIPKKSRRKKKNKESAANGGGSSTRSSNRLSDVDSMSDYMSETGSVRSMPQFDHRDDF